VHPPVAGFYQLQPDSRDRRRAPEHTGFVQANTGITSQVLGLSPPRHASTFAATQSRLLMTIPLLADATRVNSLIFLKFKNLAGNH